MSTDFHCPECNGALILDLDAQTESPVFVQTCSRVEMRIRPVVVAFCMSCEFAIEVNA
jgi:hypothetical protein